MLCGKTLAFVWCAAAGLNCGSPAAADCIAGMGSRLDLARKRVHSGVKVGLTETAA